MTANWPGARRSGAPALLWGLLLACGGPATAGWQLVWNDEFGGSSLDSTNWAASIGNGFYAGSTFIYGWGNNELEYYTSRPANLSVSNGVLHLMARQEAYAGFHYTSARINTQGLFATAYGRVEFRAKLPYGLGYWPALWLMPESSVYGSWPASGEIDVMENKGSVISTVSGTLHYGSPGNDVYNSQSYVLPNGGAVTNFHVYRIDWMTNAINWYVDGALYQTLTSWFTSAAPYPAPFNEPFYLIMNLAVGGNFLNSPTTNAINANTPFPGDEQIDYVRVFKWTAAPEQLPVLNARLAAGALVIGGSNGFPNAPFLLLTATNPAQPAGAWTTLLTNAFDASGSWSCTNHPQSNATFYQVQVP